MIQLSKPLILLLSQNFTRGLGLTLTPDVAVSNSTCFKHI